MEFVMSFWVPILCTTGVVFVASWLVWMVLPHHKSDWRRFENEDEVMVAIREGMTDSGEYQFPYVDPKGWKDPEVSKRWAAGPTGIVVVFASGRMQMWKPLLQHFLHTLVLTILVCFFAYRSLGFGAQYLSVLRVAGFVAVLAYVGPLATQSIWFGRPWGTMLKHMVDGVVYGLLMASMLGWLWPFSA